MLSHMNSEIMD